MNKKHFNAREKTKYFKNLTSMFFVLTILKSFLVPSCQTIISVREKNKYDDIIRRTLDSVEVDLNDEFGYLGEITLIFFVGNRARE